MKFTLYYVICFGVLVGVSHSGPSRHKGLVLEKEKAFREAKYVDSRRSASCTSLRRSKSTNSLSSGVVDSAETSRERRNKRAAGQKDALYFGGGHILRLRLSENRRKVLLPEGAFTIEAWLKPEGGQQNGASIIGLYDDCLPSKGLGWSLGISSSEPNGNRDTRINFRIRTDRAREETVLWTPNKFAPGVWSHVAITYDRKRTKIYINGAKVSVTTGQKGDLFTQVFRRCKDLFIGGEAGEDTGYRGAIGALRIWNVPRRHHEIVANMFMYGLEAGDELVFEDTFSNQDSWVLVSNKSPSHTVMLVDPNTHDIALSAPPCGQTICDDPVVVNAYLNDWRLREMKTIRYNVINVVGEGDRNPTVTPEQVKLQDSAIRTMFKPYNINWQLEEIRVENATLRNKTVLFGCDPFKVGDGYCHSECLHAHTGWDGGDCDPRPPYCDFEKIGDGDCDNECNIGLDRWDGGDCCYEGSKSCFDPYSRFRIYMSVGEYKEAIGLLGSRNLNVYFANWTDESLLGVATLPWERTVFGVQGGVVVRPDAFGLSNRTKNLVHELGHVLGLWHVHYGVSEMSCGDPCVEFEPSMVLGDLCSDTSPTPENPTCSDPLPDAYPCSVPAHTYTPYNNYMSYSGEGCSDHFTPQQVARMHCYADLIYQAWQEVRVPSPLPLSPQPIRSSRERVSLAWVGPLGKAGSAEDPICTDCFPDYSLVQHASAAYSPNPSSSGDYSTPIQATGRPDSPECGASTWAWMPDVDDCSDDRCFIELSLTHPVVPRRLSLWLTWEASQASHIQLIYSNGKIEEIEEVYAQCDMPWTMDLTASNVLEKVVVYVSSPFVGVDALSVWSKPNVNQCKPCKPLTYEVSRDPPFESRQGLVKSRESSREFFTDEDVEVGTTYHYTVTALLGTKAGKPSPALVYTHGQDFCGDGSINNDTGEVCDDGNRRDGDGCNMACQIEADYYCTGDPSLCYRHLGDGTCEMFERQSSPEDCGFYTPPGYLDQWAFTAQADPRFQLSVCPTSVVLGPPQLPLSCQSTVDSMIGWTPCGYLYDESLPWLKVFVEKPVVVASVLIYFHSDGQSEFDMLPKKIDVSLIRNQDDGLFNINKDKQVLCQENPMSLSITHDMSKPFFLSKGVHITLGSSRISISAVVVRSGKTSLPLISDCLENNLLYNPKTGRCVDYQCEAPVCEKPDIKNGEFNCNSYDEGDFCTASCEDGYEMVGEKIITCMDGHWTGDVTCSNVDCGVPEMSYAKFDCPDGTTFGSRCKFDCRSPAKKQGASNTIACEADGLWSAPEGYCQVMCRGPPSVKNTTLVSKSCSGSDQSVGTECKLKCGKGFHVQDNPIGKRIMKYRCGESGEWEGQTCTKVRCPPADPIYHGLYSCTDGNFVNSTCTLKCPGPNGASSRVKCQAAGSWDREWATCKFPRGDCSDPAIEERIGFHCPSKAIGSKCEVHCPPNQAPIRQKSEPSAPQPTPPEQPTSADYILCTGSKTWYPPLEEIVCVEKCKPDFIGDGYCDGVNNKAMCGWDGGDCCPSTVPGGVVQPFPTTCMEPCACKDPDAQENRRVNRIRRLD